MKRYLKTPEEVIDALQAGKKVETEDLEYKFINGILVATSKTNKHWIVYPALSASIDHYINESKSLKLEVGKFYKTRNGRKAFVYAKTDEGKYNCWAVIVNSIMGGTFCCTANGEYTANKESENDLVEPWEE